MSFGAKNPMNPNNDFAVPNAPDDSISNLTWSSAPRNLLAASSWNKQVRVWEVQQGNAIPRTVLQHQAPVLSSAFSEDGERIFTGGCDKVVKLWQLSTGQSTVLGQHDAPIKEVRYIRENQLLVTGSWDKTLRYWDVRAPKCVLQTALSDRVYAMDCTHPVLVVGTANRQFTIINLTNPSVPFRSAESPLKMQTRCIANFPDKTGFAIGSIEGRVGIHHVDEKSSSKNFAFKCHRQNEEVYSVNNIAFHPWGTFATCGADGVYTFWDKDSKQRLKQFERAASPVTSSCFNADGTIFAYSLSYDWSQGAAYFDKSKQPSILLHSVKPDEIKPRKG